MKPEGFGPPLLTSVLAPRTEVAGVVRREEEERNRRLIWISLISWLVPGVLAVATNLLTADGGLVGGVAANIGTVVAVPVAIAGTVAAFTYGRLAVQRVNAGSPRVQALDMAVRIRTAYLEELYHPHPEEVSMLALGSQLKTIPPWQPGIQISDEEDWI